MYQIGHLSDMIPYAWAASAAMSAITSKHILTFINYHYPFHLLLMQLVAATLLLVCSTLFQKARSSEFSEKGTCLNFSVVTRYLRQDSRLLLSAACLAMFFPLWTQAMLHFENITALLMLLPLVVFISTFILQWWQDSSRLAWYKSRVCTILISCFLIVSDDYRLTPNGLIFGILSLLCLASASLLYHEHARHSGDDRSIIQQKYMLPASLLPIIVTTLCCTLGESTNDSSLQPKDKLMLCINLISSAVSFILGLQMLDHTMLGKTTETTPFVLVGFAAFCTRLFAVQTYLSLLQVAAFVIGIVCTSGCLFSKTSRYSTVPSLDVEQLSDPSSRSSHRTTKMPKVYSFFDPTVNGTVEAESEQRPLSRKSPIVMAILALASIAWTWFLLGNFSSMHIETTTATKLRLDRTYRATSELDIVVSMYKESPSAVKSTYEQLMQILEVGRRNPRLIIYTKDPSADIEELQAETGAAKVVQLDNVGREGHTYLHHIIEQWEDLAAQTFFLQGDIHNPREFFPRVEDYYSPQTGMLSLGFSGQTCDCDTCGDRFGWSDQSGIIADLWREATGKSCDEQRVLLSYKSQFVVSAARLRANERSLYERLRDALVEPDSWAHQDHYLQGRPDSLNAPYFGYTLERMWSVLFQCSEGHIAARCPTLLSGTRRGGSQIDCQCFDTL